MANRMTIKLSYPHLTRDPKLDLQSATEAQRWVYLVVQVKNSTMFSPGSYLTKQDVDDLCGKDYWDVTVVSSNPN